MRGNELTQPAVVATLFGRDGYLRSVSDEVTAMRRIGRVSWAVRFGVLAVAALAILLSTTACDQEPAATEESAVAQQPTPTQTPQPTATPTPHSHAGTRGHTGAHGDSRTYRHTQAHGHTGASAGDHDREASRLTRLRYAYGRY